MRASRRAADARAGIRARKRFVPEERIAFGGASPPSAHSADSGARSTRMPALLNGVKLGDSVRRCDNTQAPAGSSEATQDVFHRRAGIRCRWDIDQIESRVNAQGLPRRPVRNR